ncbi:MAG: GNAT family N-acetyltransferase [Caldimonas sp.]
MFSFDPLTGNDLPLLHEWLQRPHVAAWWAEPATLAALERDHAPGIRGDVSTRAWIARVGTERVGFVQSYVVLGSGDGWWEDETDPGARGIDQFLAHAHQLGRGLGSTMVRAFVERLFLDPAVTLVQTDPAPGNERAIRSFRRAGFVSVGEVETPDGPAHLMRVTRAGLRLAR